MTTTAARAALLLELAGGQPVASLVFRDPPGDFASVALVTVASAVWDGKDLRLDGSPVDQATNLDASPDSPPSER